MLTILSNPLYLVLCGTLLVSHQWFEFGPDKELAAASTVERQSIETDTELIREEIIRGLQDYQEIVATELNQYRIKEWDSPAFSEILSVRDQALTAFDSGAYSEALILVQQLQQHTADLLRRAETEVQQSREQATAMVEQGRYEEAKLALEKALQLQPDSAEILALEQQIELLPKTLELDARIKVARIENDLELEYRLLEELLELAPERQEEVRRLRSLADQITAKQFDREIGLATEAVTAKNSAAARRHYLRAKEIDPQREELQLLGERLTKLEQEQRVQQALSQAYQAIRGDNWQQARIFFLQAAEDMPEDTAVAEGLRRSTEVLAIKSRFKELLANPYQLQHQSVRDKVEQVLERAKEVSSYSFSVLDQARELEELLVLFNRPVAVTVVSDTLTSVSVRGMGKVGMVEKKTINLKPGDYTFEGRRKGYTSVLVPARIGYDIESFTIRVVCDEPI